jgi:type IV pilus assembly protein PilM
MKNSPAVRTVLYSGDLLAVDLGTFAVKVLHLKAKERSLEVAASGRREVWTYLQEPKTDQERAEIYGRALRELLGELGLKLRNASISLSGNVILLRFWPMPQGYTQGPDRSLPPQARSLIPFEEADFAYSTRVIEDASADAKPRPELLIAAAQKSTVDFGMSVVRKAGLRPAVMVNDALALCGVFEFFESVKEKGNVVLVSAGASATSVCVLENGVLRAARVFNIAGSSFTRAVKREFGIDLPEAEKLKIASGLGDPKRMPGPDDPVAERVARCLAPLVKDFAGEIQRTIDVFHERRPAEQSPVKRVILAGGSAALKGFPEALAAQTGLDVEVFRPMVNVGAKGGGIGIAPLAPDLTTACGLALSNTLLRRTRKPRINLIPKKIRRLAVLSDVSPNFWRLVALPAVVVIGLAVYGIWELRLFRAESAVEGDLQKIERSQEQLEGKFHKKVVKAPPAAPQAKADPFAWLGRMSVSGVFGDGQSTTVILNHGAAMYNARGGRLFDANEEAVSGVASKIYDEKVVLTAGGKSYSIALPK